MASSQAAKFCRCVKSVRRSVTLRKGAGKGPAAKESAAIAICTKSILQTRGKTLRRIKCTGKGGPKLTTQKMRRRA